MPRIAHLTESGLLARIVPSLPRTDAVEVGPGDDAAVVHLASPRVVVTTDTMTEGHDFLLRATRPEWIGHKAAVQNLADLAAMGARPVALVVSVSAPGTTDATVLEGISSGLAERAARDGASVVGGDLGAAESISVTVTALGELPDGHLPVLRSGAVPGQVLAVGSESLGRSAAGLAWILAGREDDPRVGDLVRWHDAPDPDLRLGWGIPRRDDGSATAGAMIDISDGLVRDAGRIARASDVLIDLDGTALASDVDALAAVARPLDADPWALVLHGGEEHAMLATFDEGRVPAGFRPIGRVLPFPEGTRARVLLDGAAIDGEGFDHFA